MTDSSVTSLTVEQALALHHGMKLHQRAADAAEVDLPGLGSSLELQRIPRPGPPLPACPSCAVVPDEVRQRDSHVRQALEIAFLPCGHRFEAGAAALRAIYERETGSATKFARARRRFT